MPNRIIIIGRRSSIAQRLAYHLAKKYSITTVSASDLLARVREYGSLDEYFSDHYLIHDECSEYLFVLCYRIRGSADIASLVSSELELTRAILSGIYTTFKRARTVIIGSPTGSLVHAGSDEAYHYQKDIQKSIFRYHSSRLGSEQFLNMIELWSSFIKYNDDELTPSYSSLLDQIREVSKRKTLVDYSSLAASIEFLFDTRNLINGTIVRLDNGVSNVQHF